jgi:uncharacterized protein (DUF779 family)
MSGDTNDDGSLVMSGDTNDDGSLVMSGDTSDDGSSYDTDSELDLMSGDIDVRLPSISGDTVWQSDPADRVNSLGDAACNDANL